MVDHAPRVDEVELAVAERQRLGVGDAQLGLETLEREPLAHRLDRRLGQIDACRIRAGPHELDEVRAEPDADLEDALAAPTARTLRSRDERLELVPAALDVLVELARPWLAPRSSTCRTARACQ